MLLCVYIHIHINETIKWNQFIEHDRHIHSLSHDITKNSVVCLIKLNMYIVIFIPINRVIGILKLITGYFTFVVKVLKNEAANDMS